VLRIQILNFCAEKFCKRSIAAVALKQAALLETHVVETEKIDDGGNICFFIPQPQTGAVNHSVVNIRYQNEQQAYCVKVLGRILEQPTHLAIVYSYGECRMQYLKVKAKILSASIPMSVRH